MQQLASNSYLSPQLQLVVCPIVREADGLALSSRNRYLSAKEREHALVLHRALGKMEEVAASGERSSARLIEAAREILAQEPGVRVDYVAVVDPETLKDVFEVTDGALAAVAAFVGATRLIDNVLL